MLEIHFVPTNVNLNHLLFGCHPQTGFAEWLDILQQLQISINTKTLIIFTVIGILYSVVGKRALRGIVQESLQRILVGILVIMGSLILTRSVLDLTV